MYTKKTAVDLTDLAVGIIVLGIVVTIGATILINFRDSRLTSLSTNTIADEAFSGTQGTAVNLQQRWVTGITSVVNRTDGSVVPTTNYTSAISTADGTASITLTADSIYNKASGISVNYTIYNTTRADYDLANDSAIGIGEYGNWFKIIVIVGVAALVLSIIFMSFGRSAGGQGGGQGY